MAVLVIDISEADPLLLRKREVLQGRGLELSYQVSEKEDFHPTGRQWRGILETARIVHLSEIELYFLEDEDAGSVSPRNELEALSTVHTAVSRLLKKQEQQGSKEGEGKSCQWLLCALNEAEGLLAAFGKEAPAGESVSGSPSAEDRDVRLQQWAQEQGVKTCVQAAAFGAFGRGAMATKQVAVGETVVEVPRDLLLCSETAMRSDMGDALRAIAGLEEDTVVMLWTMIERHHANSIFAPFFASLPKELHTGLSFPHQVLQELAGTLLFEEIMQAREHLRVQYEALFPTLTHRFPEAFPADLCSWPAFLWAAQLWYSYGIKVLFPDGHLRTCLVPIASLLNHSVAAPHVTHYSRLDAATSTLRLPALRPLSPGQQCFLSYGPLPSSHLLLFYGFAPTHQNPYDTLTFDLELPEDGLASAKQSLLDKWGLSLTLQLRGGPPGRGLPSRVQGTLRVLLMKEAEMEGFSGNPRKETISAENELEVANTLLPIVDAFLEPYASEQDASDCGEMPGPNIDEATIPGLQAARLFKQGQRALMKSIRTCCSEYLERTVSKYASPAGT